MGTLRFAHPTATACVAACQSTRAKIFHFTEIRFRRMCRSSRLTKRGDLKSSCSRAGLAVDSAASAREARAGRVVPVSPRLRADDGAVRLRLARKFPAPSTGLEKLRRHGGPCVRQNRVVLAVVATVKPFAEVCVSPTGRTASSIRGAREAKGTRLPGEHGISRPTIAQGRPSDWLHLYAAVRFLCATSSRSGPRVRGQHPAFPAPSWLRG